MPQAWGTPLAVHNVEFLNTTNATQSVSGISQDDYDKMARENRNLTRQLAELIAKMNSWEQPRQPVQPPPPVRQEIQTTPVFDMQVIEAAIAVAAEAAAERAAEIAVTKALSQVHALQQANHPPQQVTAGGANNSIQTADDIGMLDVGQTPSFDLDNSIDTDLTDKPNDKRP
jgi:hypothetical protein